MARRPITPIRPNATGCPGYSETLPCEPQSAGRARILVRAALIAWRLDHLVDDAALVITELVGNAARHSGSRVVRVSVTRPAPDRVRLAVSDRSPEPPRLHTPAEDEEAGRGLLMIGAVAHRWDTELRRWGKVVWAEFRVPGDA
ncbi:ATP-binding protein [Streptomyces cucumeris]|uniref:ATP-binding protein n=1 Tax=Streptomyces cucumeris TaxID=2962890 RepID=UPI003D72E25F